MKLRNAKILGVAMGAGLLATIAMLPQAKADLVYEQNGRPVNPSVEQPQVQERTQVQAQNPVIIQNQAPAVQAQPTVRSNSESAIEHSENAGEHGDQNMSRSELLRRERMRQEVQNEDVLQERLEQLRLRDEKGRTEKILTDHEQPSEPVRQMPVKEEVVVVPVTEHQNHLAARDEVVVEESASTAKAELKASDRDERSGFFFAPRAGYSSLINDYSYVQFRNRFSLGAMIGANMSDNVSLLVGYTYADYGISEMGTPLPTAFDGLTFKNNTIDAGLKFHLMGSDSRVRPFIGAGMAYSKGFVNYAQFNGFYYGNNAGNYNPDVSVSAFTGTLSGGVDFKIAKSIYLGGTFEYYQSLSSNLSGAIYTDPNRSYNASLIATSNTYSITGDVSFVF